MLWIIIPAHIKSIALKKAWESKWKKDNIGFPIPKINIIIPNCLSVDKAIIFFISISPIAVKPAIIIVIIPINNKIYLIFISIIIKFIRINKYTPAVTSVEEWTKAETGVGAAIAAGNHAENGIWALLVHAEIIIKYTIISEKTCENEFMKI